MRLCFVVHQFFPYAQSGTEQYCLAVAREARRRGDDVTILSLHWAHDRKHPPIELVDEPFDGFRVLRLSHWRNINPNDILRDYDNRHLEGWFAKVLDEVRPDAVHFFHLRQLGSTWIDVANRRGCRTVVNLMDFWFLCPRFTLRKNDGTLCSGPEADASNCVTCNHPGLQDVEAGPAPAELRGQPPHRRRALLDRREFQLEQLSGADAVVAPSRFLADMFRRNGFAQDTMEVVPYGLEADRIRALPVERPRTPMRFAFCGVLSPWKAPGIAVNAVRQLPPDLGLTLQIHGNTDETMFADYIARVRSRADGDERITFHGPYSREQASEVFAGIDVLIVPSTWYENTPFVVLEAFTAGVPVIASDLGGLSEIVEHERNGLLFAAGDASALAKAIRRLHSDAELYARLRPQGPRSIAADYDRFRALYAG